MFTVSSVNAVTLSVTRYWNRPFLYSITVFGRFVVAHKAVDFEGYDYWHEPEFLTQNEKGFWEYTKGIVPFDVCNFYAAADSGIDDLKVKTIPEVKEITIDDLIDPETNRWPFVG